MVRTVSHVEDEETPVSSSPIERMRVDQKMDSSRSKHSETEQRRRSKINERFQILRDLIPENDQKRDKASLLLEVIQYIQFLQEKLQMYEGTCQGWSSEPGKLAPWKVNSEPAENFLDQTHPDSQMPGHDNNGVLSPSINARNSVESGLVEGDIYKTADDLQFAGSQAPLILPMQAPTFVDISAQPHQECFTDAEGLARFSRSQFWHESCVDNSSVPNYATHEDELKGDRGENTISSAYSQGILHSLTNVLQSSGVDLSQTSISVQLEVGKQADNGNTMSTFNLKDNQKRNGVASVAPVNNVENYEQPRKRFRADQN